MYRSFGKRGFDLAVAVPCLILLSPLLIALALLVRWRLGAPVLFRQLRPGKDGRPFTIYKFRSMTGECDAVGNLLPDAKRLPRVGRFLRASSLDELPELINVIRGDMSLVGPRPLLMQYLARYNLAEMRRHEVKPGVTGWAQVNGRNALAWSEKFALDVWYVDNVNVTLDLRILAMTVKRVLSREGVSADGEATMPEFTGPR